MSWAEHLTDAPDAMEYFASDEHVYRRMPWTSDGELAGWLWYIDGAYAMEIPSESGVSELIYFAGEAKDALAQSTHGGGHREHALPLSRTPRRVDARRQTQRRRIALKRLIHDLRDLFL